MYLPSYIASLTSSKVALKIFWSPPFGGRPLLFPSASPACLRTGTKSPILSSA